MCVGSSRIVLGSGSNGPSAPKAKVRVLAAVIQCCGTYLLCQRPSHKRHGGLWEFPGGKLEPGESLLETAIRELAEELDIRVTGVGEVLFTARDPGSEFAIAFVPTSIEGDPKCLEHTDLCWLTLDEMQQMPLAPADRQFAEFQLAVNAQP